MNLELDCDQLACNLLQMQCAADVSAALHRRRPAYAATLPHRYTNRPFGRQRTYTKRLINARWVGAPHSSPRLRRGGVVVGWCPFKPHVACWSSLSATSLRFHVKRVHPCALCPVHTARSNTTKLCRVSSLRRRRRCELDNYTPTVNVLSFFKFLSSKVSNSQIL